MKHRGLGWLRGWADRRDYGEGEVAELVQRTALKPSATSTKEPPGVDLRAHCSPIEDQGNLGSCTAHAAVGLVEFMERRALGRHVDASRRFVYKATRKLAGLEGDSGAFLRDAMRALVLLGAPPEAHWPYTDGSGFDDEPPAFVYALGQPYRSVRYFRLDRTGSVQTKLDRIRRYLAGGIPSMFGFSVYTSFFDAPGGEVPMPKPSDRLEGGHAIVAVGYDDTSERLLFRNSWGADWGDRGYGTLPYAYVTEDLADDFWCVLSQAWVETGVFA